SSTGAKWKRISRTFDARSEGGAGDQPRRVYRMFTTLISTDDLSRLLGKPDVVICDVRHDLAQPDTWGEAEYAKGHLPGAQFVHVDRDLSAPKTGKNGRHPLPTPEFAAALFARLGIDE